MVRKRKYNQPIMVPEAADRMHEMRCEIAKRMGYLIDCDPHWWDKLSPMQQSQINGMVTKLMIEKAKRDIMQGTFYH